MSELDRIRVALTKYLGNPDATTVMISVIAESAEMSVKDVKRVLS